MKKLLLLIVLLFAFSLQVWAEKVTKEDKVYMDFLFNAELQKADSVLNIQASKMPDHPKYHMLKAHYNFYSRFFTAGADRDSVLGLIVQNSQKAIELGKAMDETPEINFYIGSAYGLLSRALVMQQENWDGYWAARDCRNFLEDALDEDPSLHDAYLGLGVIEYFTGLRYTGFYNFLVWFVGMSGDRDKGLEYISLVAEKGELFKNEATLILGTLYGGNENDPGRAIEYLTQSMKNFPDNNFYLNQYNRAVFLNKVNEEGVGFLETEIDSLQTRYNIGNSFVLNALAYNFMTQERYDDALVVLKTNMKLYPGVANCYDSMAECYLNRGEEDMAIKYYKQAWETLKTDSTITDQFRETLTQGIPERLESLGVEVEM